LLTGRGGYWQQGSGDELRVRLELQIAGQEASLLQVSDGRDLWTERRLPIARNVTRIKLRQLRAELMLSDPLGDLQPGNASWVTTPPELTAQFGGLPSLLFSLQENFTFMPPQPTRLILTDPNGKQTASTPYFAVVGLWRPAKLTAQLPREHAATVADQTAESLAKIIPARLPDEVLILFGQSDLFPHRIEYRKLQTPVAAVQSGAAIPYQFSARPMVVLEFDEVQFDAPIDPGQFIYTPGDADWSDHTEVVLERLRRTQQFARRPQPSPK
jgi:hypothetical protein